MEESPKKQYSEPEIDSFRSDFDPTSESGKHLAEEFAFSQEQFAISWNHFQIQKLKTQIAELQESRKYHLICIENLITVNTNLRKAVQRLTMAVAIALLALMCIPFLLAIHNKNNGNDSNSNPPRQTDAQTYPAGLGAKHILGAAHGNPAGHPGQAQ